MVVEAISSKSCGRWSLSSKSEMDYVVPKLNPNRLSLATTDVVRSSHELLRNADDGNICVEGSKEFRNRWKPDINPPSNEATIKEMEKHRLQVLTDRLSDCTLSIQEMVERVSALTNDNFACKTRLEYSLTIADLKLLATAALRDPPFAMQEGSIEQSLADDSGIQQAVLKTCLKCGRDFNGPRQSVNPRFAAHVRYCKVADKSLNPPCGEEAVPQTLVDCPLVHGQDATTATNSDHVTAGKDSHVSREEEESVTDAGTSALPLCVGLVQWPPSSIDDELIEIDSTAKGSVDFTVSANAGKSSQTGGKVSNLVGGFQALDGGSFPAAAPKSTAVLLTPKNKRPSKIGKRSVENAVRKFYSAGSNE